MRSDVLYALRSFSKTPALTATILITLALGIGANSAIFTIVNAVLLRPFPYEDAASLYRVRRGTSFPDLQDWVRATRSFSAIGGFRPQLFDYTGGSQAERIDGALVTGSLMALLGAPPLAGRLIEPTDDSPGAEPVVVVTESFWRQELGGDPSAVGRRMSLSGASYTIVGIVAREFALPGAKAAVLAPFLPAAGREATSRGAHTLRAFVRLAPGISPTQAQQEMDALAVRLEQQYPDTNRDVRFRLQALDDSVVGAVRPALLMLFGTVAFVLLIACVNVANLLIARGAARRSELAVRSALGASRARIVRQLLVESVILGVAGGALALAVAYWLTQAIAGLAPEDVPRLDRVGIDRPVLVFTAALSLVTGFIFGMLPAWSGASTSLADAARGGTRATPRGGITGVLLVASEVALALVLVVGAGLLLRSFAALSGQELGFQASGLLTGNLNLTGERYGRVAPRTRLYQDLEQRLGGLPGVRGVALTTDLPIGGNPLFHNLAFEGRPMTPGTEPEVYYRGVSAGYFQTLGIPIMRGRTFTPDDRAGSVPVAIVNASFVREYYPDEEVLGRRVRWASGDGTWITIVGVAADVRALSLDQGEVPAVYIPYAQELMPWRRWMDVAVRVEGPPLAHARAVRAELARIDRTVPLARVRSMDDVIAASTADRRFHLVLLGGFAALALVLAAAGTYGVMAYGVAQRTRELGIRMALGATRRDVTRLVLRRGLAMAAAGVAAGLLGAALLSRLLADMLFQVRPADPVTFAAAAVVLLLAAGGACYAPARRASHVDPLTALRSE